MNNIILNTKNENYETDDFNLLDKLQEFCIGKILAICSVAENNEN